MDDKEYIIRLLHSLKGKATIGEVADAILDWKNVKDVFNQSFSAAISQDEKICPKCGQINADYTRKFRAKNINPLRVLNSHNRPMTTNDIKKIDSKTNLNHFKELTLWGLVQGLDGKQKNDRYVITNEGKQFLSGKYKIAVHIPTYKDQTGEIVARPVQDGTELVDIDFILKNDTRQDDEREHFNNALPKELHG